MLYPRIANALRQWSVFGPTIGEGQLQGVGRALVEHKSNIGRTIVGHVSAEIDPKTMLAEALAQALAQGLATHRNNDHQHLAQNWPTSWAELATIRPADLGTKKKRWF